MASSSRVIDNNLFAGYELDDAWDEMFDGSRVPRSHYQELYSRLLAIPADELRRRKQAADLAFLNQGITFNVYGREEGAEQIFPHDLLPRIIARNEWREIEAGLIQRITALNLFIQDIYHEGRILADKVVPREVIYTCRHYRREMRGIHVPQDRYLTVVGTDLIRRPDGRFVVLEDNLRVPSGASYMLTGREIVKRMFPALYQSCGVMPIDHYSQSLLSALRALASPEVADPTIVLLSPGIYNSAYFEHAFLARQMGIDLVEGCDLAVHDDIVYIRTTSGLRQVDVIYRRIDDDFIDPLAFRADSGLGAAGLFNAYRAGNVALANAIGTGVADDKAVYAYVPDIIRYYLDQDPILENVETYLMTDDAQRAHVLDHIDQMVVKAVGESGGYGMLIGPHSSAEQQEEF